MLGIGSGFGFGFGLGLGLGLGVGRAGPGERNVRRGVHRCEGTLRRAREHNVGDLGGVRGRGRGRGRGITRVRLRFKGGIGLGIGLRLGLGLGIGLEDGVGDRADDGHPTRVLRTLPVSRHVSKQAAVSTWKVAREYEEAS